MCLSDDEHGLRLFCGLRITAGGMEDGGKRSADDFMGNCSLMLIFVQAKTPFVCLFVC